MNKIYTILLFSFFFYTPVVLSQSFNKIEDTLKVATFQKFKIPPEKNWVASPIRKLDIVAKLYSKSGSFIKNIDEIWRDKSASKLAQEVTGERGTTVQSAVFVTIEKPGTYYLVTNLTAIDEDRRSLNVKKVALIEVTYPTIASNVSLRENNPYYYTEKLSFSFATLEFANPNNYSYEILNSSKKIIESGNTSLVVLDTLFNDLQNIGQTFTIKGLYNGKTFSYIGQNGKKVHLSKWKVTLAAPNTANLSDWAFDAKNTTLGISIYNPAARRIFYTMNASTSAGSYVFVKPIIKNLITRSEPQGLLKNVRIVSSNVFEMILFDYDPIFIESMEDYSAKKVKIIIEFDTQFNKHEKFEYKATLLK